MNKLYGSKTYLVGAMDRVADHGAEWREWITPKLHDLGIMVYNPCNKKLKSDDDGVLEDDDSREARRQWKQDENYMMFRTVKKIRSVDLRMVDTSDFLIANIDMDIHACGTYEEIVTANRQKKPVLVHCVQGKQAAPDWLFFMLPHQHIFSSWEELLAYLETVNIDGDDGTNRWVFFDLSEEVSAIGGGGFRLPSIGKFYIPPQIKMVFHTYILSVICAFLFFGWYTWPPVTANEITGSFGSALLQTLYWLGNTLALSFVWPIVLFGENLIQWYEN